MPEQDAVIAITSESPSMQGELDLVWNHLLPAMKNETLPADTASQASLQHMLSALALSPPSSQKSSPVATKVSGKTFKLQTNSLNAEHVSLQFENAKSIFKLKDDKGEYPVDCGVESWIEGETRMPGTPPTLTYSTTGLGTKVAASGTWQSEDTYEMTWRYFETPHHDKITCRFSGDSVSIQFLNSITQLSSSHLEKRPTLQGVCA